MSANEILYSESIRHQVELAKYSNHVVKRLMALLNRSDENLFRELMDALSRLDADSFTVQRLESLLYNVNGINAQAYALIGDEFRQELRDFVKFEVSYQTMTLQSVLPVQLNVASVSVEQVYAAAMARPFQGVLLREALDGLEAAKARRIRQTIAQGFMEGKTASEIVRQLRGTKAFKYKDGLIDKDRIGLQSIIQTALSHTAGVARSNVFGGNSDVLKGVMWSSTLDIKTTAKCWIRDGKLYTVEGKPIGHSIPSLGFPPLHYNCRSATVPMVKSFKELFGIDVDESQFPEGMRASLDGAVPAETTYSEWLTKQSAERQNEVLGDVRGKLLREGKLTVEQMYSQKGEYLTLKELKAKYGF